MSAYHLVKPTIHKVPKHKISMVTGPASKG